MQQVAIKWIAQKHATLEKVILRSIASKTLMPRT